MRSGVFTRPSKYGTYTGPRGNPDQWRRAAEERMSADEARTILGTEAKETGPWAVLGITRAATLAEAKSAYRRLMLEHHPDRGGDPEMARRVIAAWTLIEESFQ